MTRSIAALSLARRSSMTLTGIAPERRSRPICVLNASSWLTMKPTSCAMLFDQPDGDRERAEGRRTDVRIDETANRRDAAVDLIAVETLDEEAHDIRQLEVGIAAVGLASCVVVWIVERQRCHARTDPEGAVSD